MKIGECPACHKDAALTEAGFCESCTAAIPVEERVYLKGTMTDIQRLERVCRRLCILNDVPETYWPMFADTTAARVAVLGDALVDLVVGILRSIRSIFK